MTPAQRLLIVLGGSLMLIMLAVFIVYPIFRQPEPAAAPVAQPTIQDPSTLTPVEIGSNLPATQNETINPTPEAPVSETAQRAEVERLSRLFVERFGSYSNYSNFENITSLYPFMTASMRAYADGLKKEPQNGQGASDYYGVTSTVVSLNTKSFAVRDTASVNFVIQQETQQGLSGEITAAFRDGRVELVYEDGQWKVDGLFYN